jgi:hypothetical protein
LTATVSPKLKEVSRIRPNHSRYDHGGKIMGGLLGDVTDGNPWNPTPEDPNAEMKLEWRDAWKKRIIAEAGDHLIVGKNKLSQKGMAKMREAEKMMREAFMEVESTNKGEEIVGGDVDDKVTDAELLMKLSVMEKGMVFNVTPAADVQDEEAVHEEVFV